MRYTFALEQADWQQIVVCTYMAQVYLRILLIFICKMQEDLELVDFVCIIADMQSCRWKLEICYRRYNREQEAELSPLKRCRIWSGVIDEERPDWQSGQRKKTMLEASRPSRSRPLRWPRGCRIPATSRGKGRRKRDRIPRKGRKSRTGSRGNCQENRANKIQK